MLQWNLKYVIIIDSGDECIIIISLGIVDSIDMRNNTSHLNLHQFITQATPNISHHQMPIRWMLMSFVNVDACGRHCWKLIIGLPPIMGRPNAARIHQQLPQYWKYAPAGWEVFIAASGWDHCYCS